MLLTFRLVGEIGFVKNILFCLEFNLIMSVVDIVEREEKSSHSLRLEALAVHLEKFFTG